MISATSISLNSFNALSSLSVGSKTYAYYSLLEAEKNGLKGISQLPVSLKILLENLLRNEDGHSVTKDDMKAIAQWLINKKSSQEIAFRPARILMQDFTGVPAVVDLAAMRDAVKILGGNPTKINPLIPVDLVIDHSVMVDFFGNKQAFQKNVNMEYVRNKERYSFLKWGQQVFNNFRVTPPGTGICHQVNLEYFAKTVWTKTIQLDGQNIEIAYPDTIVGTDSHTTMINGLAVLGWGVGGIEAEAAMLGQPISMLIPEVIGLELTGKMKDGVTSTDLVLTITEMLRKQGVVGKFVEFFGNGLNHLSLEDKATIANMAPEYGATCGFFPIDEETLRYLKDTGRNSEQLQLVENYAKAQGMFRDESSPHPDFTVKLKLNIEDVEPSIAGPKRPQDRVTLHQAAHSFGVALKEDYHKIENTDKRYPVNGTNHDLGHGDVVIAAITSCTNTSNPNVMIAAGLLARNALARGLSIKPWVKTSLAPGSQVVTEYLEKAGLQKYLDQMGFNLVGYGCTTCIGNSGPLSEAISKTIRQHDIVAAAVLSGNRNFEGRINQDVHANYLASPPLVVAYALAGNIGINLTSQPLGIDKNGTPVHLTDIWPKRDEIVEVIRESITQTLFKKRYADIFKGDASWHDIKVDNSQTYQWNPSSTYVRKPPYFDDMNMKPDLITDIADARILALFLDSITTDHISPAGSIAQNSPAGRYLSDQLVQSANFNSYGARRGNDQVMMRGTFANIRLKNQMVPGVEGGMTKHCPSGEIMTIFDAAIRYKTETTPLIILAGKEYGSGSSRDWAAKGVRLLGVRAVIAESFERIHRSNLIGMGVLPLVFEEGVSWKSFGIKGNESISLTGLSHGLKPGAKLTASVVLDNGEVKKLPVQCRIDTLDELNYYLNGGILHYMLRQLLV